MASLIQDRIRSALRDEGPLTVDELLTRLTAVQPLSSKNPKGTVSNALQTDPACVNRGDGRFCYLPTSVRGATVRLPMDLTAPAKRVLVVGAEMFALLWPMGLGPEGKRSATLTLEGGPTVKVGWEHGGWPLGLRAPMELPSGFWSWWHAQREAGTDTLVVCCQDGEAGGYVVRALSAAAFDTTAVAARNAELREAAAAASKRTRSLSADDLARRLLARGVYHKEVPPDLLGSVLFEPPGTFSLESWRIVHRPELTPSVRRLFAHRFGADLWLEEMMLRQMLELPPLPEPEPEPVVEEPPQPRAAKVGYRIKVSLTWKPNVWRVIELLDNQTLEDLHYGIQGAFGWDDDHLYAFFLSGRAWDSLTEVARPFDEAEEPTADEVTLDELELKPGQRFLYIFDFGDDLRHLVEVVDSFPAPARRKFPRIVESHGKAPPQYPVWD